MEMLRGLTFNVFAWSTIYKISEILSNWGEENFGTHFMASQQSYIAVGNGNSGASR